jgi:hypothetical protein
MPRKPRRRPAQAPEKPFRMKRPKPRGPKPERVVIEGMGWEEAIGKAIRKPKPEGGWPRSAPSRKSNRGRPG